MHMHLDPVGGIAGDMFVGALLDARPELARPAIDSVRKAGLDERVGLSHISYSDGILSGSRFEVTVSKTEPEHGHVHWSSLKTRLSESQLSAPVRARAIDIFSHLAEAEAQVHGKPVDSVAFHEVGAWDSIADIVAAAYVIEQLGPCDWSIGAIPIGSGRVSTQHGLLPVPAPATVLLLDGYACFDDGFPGERVTPTGAAIVKHLDPTYGLGPKPRRLVGTGYGFGTRRFDGMSNVLRVIEFSEVKRSGLQSDQIMALHFEVDDQTAEDLAIGLEQLRTIEGVIDVSQCSVVGKRGRLLTTIQVLAKPAMIDKVTDACFHETTTLGLRLQPMDRLILPRREVTSGDKLRVKVADRPGGTTAKADIADVAAHDGHAERQTRRRSAELDVLRENENEK